MMRNDNHPKADVQLWGKGYRISADSQEFQRYLPRDTNELKGIETKTHTVPWASLLETLYPLREADVAAQRCMLFGASELLSVSFAKTEDRHRRPSLVVTACAVEIDWRNPDLGEIAARAVSLSTRLATTYSEILRGNPDNVGKQLRDESFLTSRSFDLNEERPDRGWDWSSVISAVRQWNGVTGVSSPRLVSLGANVALSTKHEAEQAKLHIEVDGFFDARDRVIKPLSERLNLWQPELATPTHSMVDENSKSSPSAGMSHEGSKAFQQSPELYWIAQCLQQLTNSIDRLVDVATATLEKMGTEKRKR